jgi:hypothetical protein
VSLKLHPPSVIAPALKKSPEGIFGYHFILLQCLAGLIGFNNLYYLSFLLSKDFRLALWALLSTVKVLMNSVNSKQKHDNNSANIKREEAVRMKKAKAVTSSEKSRKLRPALSPEARENQLISLAVDLAEKQLLEGTASSQIITHYLKLGSTKEKIEKEILMKQKELIEAKTQSLQSAKRIEELYMNALNAMRKYSGQGSSDD